MAEHLKKMNNIWGRAVEVTIPGMIDALSDRRFKVLEIVETKAWYSFLREKLGVIKISVR